MIAFKDEPGWNKDRRVPQAGTYNANPLAAAAGAACLAKVADPAVQRHCDDLAARLRAGLNDVFERREIPGFAWGESSVFHLAVGELATNRRAEDLRSPEGVSAEFLKSSGGTDLAQILEVGALLEGVHLFHAGGFFSTAHTEADVDTTIQAIDTVLGRMDAEGLFG
jgi:glutamate-1-semialdehyde 2,1-aminomutase